MKKIFVPLFAVALTSACASDSASEKQDNNNMAADDGATDGAADDGAATDSAPEPAAAKAPAQDIVAVASGAGSFNTLVAAVQAAGLVETLQGEGPFTVFAPTDEAFAKLPEGTVESLLQDKEKLTAILTYHVVAGKVTAADVGGLQSATTVQGGSLAIDTSDGVMVGGAKVVQADVMASNGVIHVIDTVLIPEG